LAGLLLAAASPAMAQAEDASPAPKPTQIPLTSESGRPDLYLQMPYYLGGFEPDIVMTRREEHFANLDADDQTRQEWESLLEEVGADVSDMVSGYALVSQEGFFSFVVAIRVEGVTPGTLLPAYLPILYEDLDDPQSVVGRMGGKDVTVITSIGSDDEYVELYVYDEGDTIWMLQGPSDVVEVTLANLPDPLSVEE
jgi:hypothetical protein